MGSPNTLRRQTSSEPWDHQIHLDDKPVVKHSQFRRSLWISDSFGSFGMQVKKTCLHLDCLFQRPCSLHLRDLADILSTTLPRLAITRSLSYLMLKISHFRSSLKYKLELRISIEKIQHEYINKSTNGI